ncbi:MAG: FtsK/SpoIIIE domain-containing protein [Anaerolineaceae bacterium]|nr:FtsK/SpoIIIE domain-containing protein [Anaerolineaceae bacterium]
MKPTLGLLLIIGLAAVLAGCTETGLTMDVPSLDGTMQALQVTRSQAIAGQTATAAEFDRQRQERLSQATQAAWQATATADVQAAGRQAASTATFQALAVEATQSAQGITATAGAAAVQASATAQAVRAEREILSIQRDRVLNTARGLVWWLILVGSVVMLIAMALWAAKTYVSRPRRTGRTAYEVRGQGVTTYLDISRSLHPAIQVYDDGRVESPPQTTPQIQREITERSLAVDFAAALPARSTGGGRPPEGMIADGASERPALPAYAPWRMLEDWHRGSFLLGQGYAGPVAIDPEMTPHLLITGTTGSGKSRSGLMPIMATALRTGWRVILLNESGGDFAPIRGHANMSAIHGDEAVIGRILDRVAAEVTRRDAILHDHGVSTWGRMDKPGELGPRVMVVVDELVSLAWGAAPAVRDQIWRALIVITSRGRKTGISAILAGTDITYRSLGRPGLVVRDNCGRMVFRTKDASMSRAAVNAPGAEELPPHHFLALIDEAPISGAGFAPQDGDLEHYLAAQSAYPAQLPAWIEDDTRQSTAWPERTIAVAERIRQSWEAGLASGTTNRSELARAAGFRQYGGHYKTLIDEAVEYLENEGSTTTPVFVVEQAASVENVEHRDVDIEA